MKKKDVNGNNIRRFSNIYWYLEVDVHCFYYLKNGNYFCYKKFIDNGLT